MRLASCERKIECRGQLSVVGDNRKDGDFVIVTNVSNKDTNNNTRRGRELIVLRCEVHAIGRSVGIRNIDRLASKSGIESNSLSVNAELARSGIGILLKSIALSTVVVTNIDVRNLGTSLASRSLTKGDCAIIADGLDFKNRDCKARGLDVTSGLLCKKLEVVERRVT